LYKKGVCRKCIFISEVKNYSCYDIKTGHRYNVDVLTNTCNVTFLILKKTRSVVDLAKPVPDWNWNQFQFHSYNWMASPFPWQQDINHINHIMLILPQIR